MVQDKPRNLRQEARQLFQLPQKDPPTIKILFYTDAPNLVTDRRVGPFSLGRMIAHLKGHSPAFARFDVRLESRYRDNSRSANNKLDNLLKKEAATKHSFDQIWFFGIHQINKTIPNFGLGGGTPESELTADEVTELKKWMHEHHGGVLVTGDHANERPRDAILDDPNPRSPDPARNGKFLGLGRALGRSIPRAGQLRVWEGDPTAMSGHRSNTHFRIRGASIDDAALQADPSPQQISHQLFDETGRPDAQGEPHPLFFYRDNRPINFLPDHMHEGTVRLPDLSDKSIWEETPDGFQPAPQVIATGIDSERGTTVDLIVAYDGTAVDVGRIVADSSWHHYFNINLESLMFPAPIDSPADQIGQFYANLAIWLAPTEKRQQMADLMVDWLASHPVVLEGFGPLPTEELSVLLGTGAAALEVLKRVACPCEIHELLQMKLSKKRQQQVETLYLPEQGVTLGPMPSKQLVLGYLVNRFSPESNDLRESESISSETVMAKRAEAINATELAFSRQTQEVTQSLRAGVRLFPLPE